MPDQEAIEISGSSTVRPRTARVLRRAANSNILKIEPTLLDSLTPWAVQYFMAFTVNVFLL